MNKKIVLILIIIVILIGSGSVYFWYQNTKNQENPNQQEEQNHEREETTIKVEEEYIKKDENGVIYDKETNEELYNPQKTYPKEEERPMITLENLDDGEISEYLKWFSFVYPERSFKSFTDDEIATIVSLASEMYIPRTEEEVQKVAKKYFNIDNYVLPTGTYELENYGNYTITKENGYYIRSNIVNQKEIKNVRFITDMTIDGNKIIMSYDFASDGFVGTGCYSPLASAEENEACIIGYYKVYLTYTPERINIDEIVYTKKE